MDSRSRPGELLLSGLLKAVSAHLSGLRVLFWRLDVRKNELTILNEAPWSGLGERLPLILKNTAVAREALVPEDRERYVKCFDRIRWQQPASTVVRIRAVEGDDSVAWVTLMGLPDPTAEAQCVGLVADCSDLVELVLGTHAEVDLESKAELFDNPVLLVRFSDKRVALANSAARRFFGERISEHPTTTLQELLAASPAVQTSDLFEALLFNGQWTGTLLLASGAGQDCACKTKIRAMSHANEHLLWMSIVPALPTMDEPSPAPIPGEEPLAAAVVEAFAAAGSIEDVLRTFLAHQPASVRAEAVMRSRIFGAENRVVVTGIAEDLAAMPSKETFPYEGSIAENIVRFGLDHLIVEDTSRSIKPIDWVLFIPKGIRSYFALPFFEGGVLKNVFIVCSTETGRFTEQNIRCFTPFIDILGATLDRLEETRR